MVSRARADGGARRLRSYRRSDAIGRSPGRSDAKRNRSARKRILDRHSRPFTSITAVTDASSILDILPLAPLQEGLLFHANYATGAFDAYTSQVVLTLYGDVDLA